MGVIIFEIEFLMNVHNMSMQLGLVMTWSFDKMQIMW
jgi:hypothetical protein